MQLALPKSLANPRGANQGYFWWDPPISLHSSHAGSPSRPYPFAWGAARPAALDLRRAKQAAELRQAEQAAGLRHVPGGAVRAGLQDSSALPGFVRAGHRRSLGYAWAPPSASDSRQAQGGHTVTIHTKSCSKVDVNVIHN
jgi:hypothetical protein